MTATPEQLWAMYQTEPARNEQQKFSVLRCPECQGVATLRTAGKQYAVECWRKGTGICCATAPKNSPEEAIAAWNNHQNYFGQVVKLLAHQEATSTPVVCELEEMPL